MHESYENEWDLVADELTDRCAEKIKAPMTDAELLEEFKIEPVSLTLQISVEGIDVSYDGENELLMLTLLSSLFKGDLDEIILNELPKYKPAFPNWGNETPQIFPDKTLWEKENDE